MALNNASISSVDDGTGQEIRLIMLNSQPNLNAPIDPAMQPWQVYGWYNGATDKVELFMTNGAGRTWIRIGMYRD